MTPIWKPNVTVAAIVAQDGKYLLVEEETSDGLRLNQPAGHLEPGESLIDGVKREALEETTRAFTPQALLGIYLSRSSSTLNAEPKNPDVTYLRFAFVGTVSAPIEGWILDTGIVRTVWMTLDEIRASADRHRSPLVLRCAEDHAGGKPLLPLDTIYVDASALYSS